MSIFSRIYSRASWGARYRAGFGDRSANYPLPEVWTHHSVTAHLSPNATAAQEKAQMRILENIGQQRFKGGISYTFIIFPSGRIYMGTGASRIGAHTINRNSVAIGVCFAGNYENARPTAAAERTYADLLRGLRSEGVIRQARTNGGHRDVQRGNACPGRYLYARIGAINTLAARGPSSGGGNSGTSNSSGGTPVATPQQNWKYGNPKIQKGRQAFNFLRFIPRDVWARKATRDFVNGDKNANGYGFMVSRIHQYTHGVWGRTWGRRQAPTQATRERWEGIREDGYLMHTWVRYTYSWARRAFDRATEARDLGRENSAMIKAMAKAIDENSKDILGAVEARETEVIQANAADVARELELAVIEDNDDEEN